MRGRLDHLRVESEVGGVGLVQETLYVPQGVLLVVLGFDDPGGVFGLDDLEAVCWEGVGTELGLGHCLADYVSVGHRHLGSLMP